MAHFAEIDSKKIVKRVVVTNNEMPNQGHDWLVETLGGTWVQTSYNTHGGAHALGGTPIRKNYAGVGFTYDSGRDAFIPPKPYSSWTLDEDTCLWAAPVPFPEDGNSYTWDEASGNWVEVTEE